MKVLTVADREMPELLEKPELTRGVRLILSCGDLAPEYLARLRSFINADLYYVPGNHDIRYQQSPPMGCTDLSCKIITTHGLAILGLPGSRWYNGGVHQYHESEMRSMIRRIFISPANYFARWRKPLDIVFAHAPPRHIHDAEDRCHRGFRCFNTLIKKYRPRYFIHGHIHALFGRNADRITDVGSTRVINSYGYHVFEIEPVSPEQPA